jgi:HEAT repeat protein
MSRRFRIVLILCLVALAGGGLLRFAISINNADDPFYHGRRLTRWLDDAFYTGWQNPATNAAAQEAVTALGTNAFPCLIRLAAGTDSTIKTRVSLWLKRFPFFHVRVINDEIQQREALYGFRLLRAEAEPAIPALSKLLNNTNSTRVASAILGDLGPEAFAPLTNALTNIDAKVRVSALGGLALLGESSKIFFPDEKPLSPAETERRAKLIVPVLLNSLSDSNEVVRATAAGSLALGWEPADAVPALIRALSDTSLAVRAKATYSLGEFGTNAIPAVPALIRELSDTSFILRLTAANALADLGTNAAPAVPALVQTLSDSNLEVRLRAVDALKAVDPSAVAKAGVK